MEQDHDIIKFDNKKQILSQNRLEFHARFGFSTDKEIIQWANDNEFSLSIRHAYFDTAKEVYPATDVPFAQPIVESLTMDETHLASVRKY